jgi:hypothetical protein
MIKQTVAYRISGFQPQSPLFCRQSDHTTATLADFRGDDPADHFATRDRVAEPGPAARAERYGTPMPGVTG